MDRGINHVRGLMTDDFGLAAACRRHENLQSPEPPFDTPALISSDAGPMRFAAESLAYRSH
jgi:hypothetical protein